MADIDERNVNPLQEMQRVLDNFSKLKEWKFEQSFISKDEKKIIYNSEWCRLNIVWGGWDPSGGNSISIYYGRSHAPNESSAMTWNGEICHVWHGLKPALYFLDGMSPEESAKAKGAHQLTDKYQSEETIKTYHRRQPEWLVKMHMDIWDFYGTRFFSLFDLRQPEIWTRYRVFIKEFYDLKGRIQSIVPPLDKAC